jgi:hypothetical protein
VPFNATIGIIFIGLESVFDYLAINLMILNPKEKKDTICELVFI